MSDYSKFPPTTKLPIAALSAADRIKRKFGGGVDLDADQSAALACFDSLPSAAQAMLVRQAAAGKMDYIPGKDLLEAKGMFTKAEGEGLLTSEMAELDEDSVERTSKIDYDTTDDEELA